MTIKQFISKLQELPQDAEVVIIGVDLHGHEFLHAPNPNYYNRENKVYL